LVDHQGEIVDGDEILFIITKAYFETGRLQGGVVGTLMTNMGLEMALRHYGIEFKRTNVGDRYISAELQRRGWILGGESSGHIICRDATTTGDGIISALKVVSSMVSFGKSLHELKSGMVKFPQKMINVNVTSPANIMELAVVKNAISNAENSLKGRGRVLVRPSGTEPVVRVMVEADDMTLVDNVVDELALKVQECQ
jgi:phosphoglucosamine mutase